MAFLAYIHWFTWVEYTVSFVVFCVTWIFYKIHISPIFSPLQNIPGYRGHWLMGVLNLSVVTKRDPGLVMLDQAQKLNREAFRVHCFLGEPAIAITGPEWYKYVTVTRNSNYHKPDYFYKVIVDLVGVGSLLAINGDEHSTQRMLCNRAFKYNVLKYLFQKVEQNSMELVRYWQELIEGDNLIHKGTPPNWVVIGSDLERSTLDTIVHVAFDYPTSILRSPDGETNNAIRGCLGFFKYSNPTLFIPFFKYLPTSSNLAFRKNKHIVDSLVKEMISTKRENAKSMDEHESADNLLMMLLLATDPDGNPMSDDRIHDQVMTFMFAGAETTSTSLQWCLHALSLHPDIQEKVRSEVNSVIPDTGTQLSLEHIDKMPYLMCFIKETLRFYSPVVATSREAVQSDVIDGWHIPAGTKLILYISAIHRNPKYWKDPDVFKPERFLNEEEIKPFTFVPFTAGPRMCIGYKFALMEMRIYIAQLLRHLKFELTPGMEKVGLVCRLTTQPDPRLVLRLTPV